MDKHTQIKIFLVEDHAIVRDGIRALLEKECLIIGEASNGKEALQKLENNRPDLILMDMNMPDMNGMECTKIVKQRYEGIKVLILSMHDDESYLLNVLSAGADGYILKNSTTDDLLFAIKKVVRNGVFISPELTMNLLQKTKSEHNVDFVSVGDITDREMDVLKLIGEGLTNSEIADRLCTSVRTIETRRKNLLDKTKTINTATLIRYAVKNGLLN